MDETEGEGVEKGSEGRVGKRSNGVEKRSEEEVAAGKDVEVHEAVKKGELAGLKKGLKRFLKDLTTVRLFVFKMIYFALLAGVVILWPQFTVHQASLGLSVTQTGTVNTVVAAVGIFVPLCSGILGDKMGNYRIMLILTTLLVGIMALLFTLVPGAATPNNNNKNNTTITNISLSTNLTSLEPTVDPDLISYTFWTYMSVRVAYGVLQAVCYTLFDAAVMAEVQTTGVDYGFQRAWGTLAVLGASLLSGYIVQWTGGFSTLFYVSAALQGIAALLMLFLHLDFKPPATALARNILHLAANAEVIMFFVAMLAAGVFFGFLETFMYRYLLSLGGTPVLIGLTVTVGAPFELVLTLLASYLVPLTGHAPIIMFGLLGHAIRLLGFSLLVDPWWVLGLEILESVSNGLLSTVGVMYCTVLFSLQSIASFRGILAVVYFGVGQSIGSASGSWLQNTFGDRGAFRTLSYVALACTIAYALSYFTLMRYRRQRASRAARASQEGVPKGESSVPQPLDLEGKKEGIDNPSWVADE